MPPRSDRAREGAGGCRVGSRRWALEQKLNPGEGRSWRRGQTLIIIQLRAHSFSYLRGHALFPRLRDRASWAWHAPSPAGCRRERARAGRAPTPQEGRVTPTRWRKGVRVLDAWPLSLSRVVTERLMRPPASLPHPRRVVAGRSQVEGRSGEGFRGSVKKREIRILGRCFRFPDLSSFYLLEVCR